MPRQSNDWSPIPSADASAAAEALAALATGTIPQQGAGGTPAAAPETGTGSLVRHTAPSLVGPITLTSLNNPSSDAAAYTDLSIDLTVNQTGTATGTTTALKVNLTETAVVGQTSLMDLQIGGASRFRVLGTAPITSAAGATWDAFKFASFTQLFKGTTSITSLISKVALYAPTLAGDTATLTIARSATLYVDGPPVQGANTSLTAKFAVLVGSGNFVVERGPGYGGLGIKLWADAVGGWVTFQSPSNNNKKLNFVNYDTATGADMTFYTAGTLRASILAAGTIQLEDAINIAVGATTGTKIGTVGGASGQKLGFFNATPIVQPVLAADPTAAQISTALANLGLTRTS